MPCRVNRDQQGAQYIVPPEPHKITPGRQRLDGRSGVAVWWDRGTKKNDEEVYIRQENEAKRADVIVLTMGQVYDLIHALNKMIEER